MKKCIFRDVRALTVLGALTLAVPLSANAESARSDDDQWNRGAESARSDDDQRNRGAESARSGNEQWNRGQAELQKHLQPGMDPAAYQKKLKELGYQITATNYNNDDYQEYEVVKGDQTWEVQVDVDEDTGKATAVDVAMNVWKTEETEAALARNAPDVDRDERTARRTDDTMYDANDRTARRPMVMRNNQYSDRDRASTDQLIRELEAIPVGQNKQFYKDTLRKRGYEVTKVNNDDDNELDLEAVKNGNSVELDIDFDENTGRSTALDASTLWAESESTTRTREAQETRMERRGQTDLND